MYNPVLQPASIPAPVSKQPSAPPRPVRTQSQPSAQTLEDLKELIGDCRECGFCESRTAIVHGEGSADADLMFIGDAPGREEDGTGRPFSGPEGSLLTDIIVKGMRFKREDCRLTYMVKCTPGHNRAWGDREARACRRFILNEIDIVKPKVIVTLGQKASQLLLETNKPIAQMRNCFYPFRGVPVMTTFHPAYLLQRPERKRETWADIKKVIERLNKS